MLFSISMQAQAKCNFFDEFTDNKDGTVTDPRNGLIWKRCAEGSEFDGDRCSTKGAELNWYDAMRAARNSNFLNQTDWRLPSDTEFKAIFGSNEKECIKAADNEELTVSRLLANPLSHDDEGRTRVPNFWSTKSYRKGEIEEEAIMGDFRYGGMTSAIMKKSNYRNFALLVRDGRAKHSMGAKVFNREYNKIGVQEIANKKYEQARKQAEERRSQAYANSPEGRAERRHQQMCESQKATCLASCPFDRVFTTQPDMACASRCNNVSCY